MPVDDIVVQVGARIRIPSRRGAALGRRASSRPAWIGHAGKPPPSQPSQPLRCGMHRRTCLLTGTLIAFPWPASHAADDVEGRWLSEVGPPDNRARVGLELERGTDGTLR